MVFTDSRCSRVTFNPVPSRFMNCGPQQVSLGSTVLARSVGHRRTRNDVLSAKKMAYSLQGCGIVLKSDIEKRDSMYAKVGRTAAQPVVSSLFIHSVRSACSCACYARCRLTLGSTVTARLVFAGVLYRGKPQVV